jgi:predicted Fe-S protein YdhL (DUF1289 family)
MTPRIESGEAGAPAPVPSPCIDVCRMNPATNWCDGCLRTIDEIAGWSRLDDNAKRVIWDVIEARHVELVTQRQKPP